MSWLSEPTDESRGNASSKSPYAAAASTAMERLGFRTSVPLHLSSAAYGRVLPVAETAGYHGALRQAFGDGQATPRDAESQLSWLADHLCLGAPTHGDSWPWWEDAWSAAAAAANVHPPDRLSPGDTRALLDELLVLPDYPDRLVDALAVTFRRRAV